MRIHIIWMVVISCCFFGSCARSQEKFTRLYPEFSINRPINFQTPPDGSNRTMIVSQPGRIYSIQNGAIPTMDLVLDLTSIVLYDSSEMGLLGLAFHPKFKENGYFYVDYTEDTPFRTVIARYTMNPPSSNTVDLSSRTIVLEIPQPPFGNHKGGCLAFGPDGYFYIGMGDGGSSGDPLNNAQNKKSSVSTWTPNRQGKIIQSPRAIPLSPIRTLAPGKCTHTD